MASDNMTSNKIMKSAAAAAAAPMKPPEQSLKCPRCDSSNTKFCYYNNYSLSQPRHFCKTCRRYWTKGGALRNVPVGGGCRKSSKKSKSCTSSSSSSSSSSMLAAAANFHLGMLPSAPPGIYGYTTYQMAAAAAPVVDDHVFGFGSMNGATAAALTTNNNTNHHHHTSIASSIESLSSINQDLHWRLQQQRLAMLFGTGEAEQQQQQQQQNKMVAMNPLHVEPVSYQNLAQEAGTTKGNEAAAASWFLDENHGSRVNGSSSNNNVVNNGASDWNGIATWSDHEMTPFSALH